VSDNPRPDVNREENANSEARPGVEAAPAEVEVAPPNQSREPLDRDQMEKLRQRLRSKFH